MRHFSLRFLSERASGRQEAARCAGGVVLACFLSGWASLSLAQSGDGSFASNPDLISGTAWGPGGQGGYRPSYPYGGIGYFISCSQFCGAHGETPGPVNLWTANDSGPGVGQGASAPETSFLPPVSAPLPQERSSSGQGAAADLRSAYALAGGGNGGAVPGEPYFPFFDVDWSLGVRATHTGGSETGRNRVTLTPRFSLSHSASRFGFSLAAEAALSAGDDQTVWVDQGLLSYGGSYELNSVASASSSISLEISQQDVNSPEVPDAITVTPVEFVLRGQGGVSVRAGRFDVEGLLALQRDYRTDTVLVGNVVQSNSERNLIRLGGTLRTAYRFSPEISLFVEGQLAHDWYDAAPVLTGVRQDGWDASVVTGVSVNWRDILRGEISLGYGTRIYDDVSLGKTGAVIYGLDVSYAPNGALNAQAEFSTSLTPADVSAGRVASVDYSASTSLSYALSSRVILRTLLSGDWAMPESGSDIRTVYRAGAGLDYALNANTSISADYLYTRAENLPAEATYEHAATLGVTFSR